MEAVEGHGVVGRREAEGYVKEFTRHSDHVLQNLNELRLRHVLTDATLVVGRARMPAHSAVLSACSGFFYSLYSRGVLQGRGREDQMSVSLPDTLEASSVRLLLDFMYTARLPLTPRSVPGVLAVATYLQMDHVADACRAFVLHSEGLGAEPPMEPDSMMSVASVAPQGGALPGPAPQHQRPAPQGGALPGPAPQHQRPAPSQPAAETGGYSARVPGDGRASLKPGAFPAHRPRAQQLKREPDTTPSPDSPSSCQPNSPAESNTCSLTTHGMSDSIPPTPDPKACHWKKYKYIVLNPLCAVATVKEEEPEEQQRHAPTSDRMGMTPKTPTEAWPGEVPGQMKRQGPASCYEGSGRVPPPGPPASDPPMDPPMDPPAGKEGSGSPCTLFPKPCSIEPEHAHHCQQPIKRENYCMPFSYSGNVGGTKTVCAGDKPYRCNICGAQFNRPANLKTHSRIHSGEKPYRCDTCGARFVQVAHLRAHVLIHTGEKPYPCHTCGTRFRHLQTLKSHLRIHTGEKPYTCETCELHFRHKSQLRLHLRQKHGAVTNTKVRYQALLLTPDL